MALAGEDEGGLHELPIDGLGRLLGVLLDHGEEVAEQNALVLGESARPGGRVRRVLVDRVALEVLGALSRCRASGACSSCVRVTQPSGVERRP